MVQFPGTLSIYATGIYRLTATATRKLNIRQLYARLDVTIIHSRSQHSDYYYY